MKVVILAAGTGTRLRPYTDQLPKCMVKLKGKRLLDYQLEAISHCGIKNVAIVTGYLHEQFEQFPVVKYFNPEFAVSNMVHSLMCAGEEFNDDIIICYGDIIFEYEVLEQLARSESPIEIIVDEGWRSLWQYRMEDPLADAETMILDNDGHICELGRKASSYDQVQGQYIGLFKWSAAALPSIMHHYRQMDRNILYQGRSFQNMFMTTFLQHLIDNGMKLKASKINHGWLEVDSVEDLHRFEKLPDKNELFKFKQFTFA